MVCGSVFNLLGDPFTDVVRFLALGRKGLDDGIGAIKNRYSFVSLFDITVYILEFPT